MERSYLENLYFKKRTPESMKKYQKQKNFCMKLYKKERRKYFESLDPSKIVGNKTFWKNVQLLSEKWKIANKVTLVGKEDKIISEDSLVSEELNFFFQNATKNLDINKNSYIKDETNEYTDTFTNTQTILVFYYLIKNNIRGATPFLFKELSSDDIEKEMLHLNPKKAGTFQDVPPKILKNSINLCSETLKLFFNDTLIHCEFLN